MQMPPPDRSEGADAASGRARRDTVTEPANPPAVDWIRARIGNELRDRGDEIMYGRNAHGIKLP